MIADDGRLIASAPRTRAVLAVKGLYGALAARWKLRYCSYLFQGMGLYRLST